MPLMPQHKRRVQGLAVPLSFITQKQVRSRTHIRPPTPPGLTANDPDSLQDKGNYYFRSQRYCF